MKEIVIMRKIQNCLGILKKNTAVNVPQKIYKFSSVPKLFTKNIYNSFSVDLWLGRLNYCYNPNYLTSVI